VRAWYIVCARSGGCGRSDGIDRLSLRDRRGNRRSVNSR
jgi:hypothetical protein